MVKCSLDVMSPPRRKRLRLVKKQKPPKTDEPAAADGATGSATVRGFCISERHPQYVIIKDALDGATLERLDEFLKKKRPKAAKMKEEGGHSDDERKARYSDRDSKVTWIDAPRECLWLHKQLAKITSEVGNSLWPLFKKDATGAPICDYEKIQYAVYGEGQHFQAWHQDAFAEGHDMEDARQLTIVVMLTARSQYKGGSFQAKVPSKTDPRKRAIRSVRLDRGEAIVFPAKQLVHRVTPVTWGIRKTLVFWANDKMSCHFYNPGLASARARRGATSTDERYSAT